MERGKFQRLVREFPFLEELYQNVWKRSFTVREIGEFPAVRVNRVDENFLMRVLYLDPDTFDDGVYEMLWSVSEEGNLREVKIQHAVLGRGGKPIVESLRDHVGSRYFVLLRRTFYLAAFVEAQSEIIVYKLPRRFDLKKEIEKYHKKRDIN